MHSTQIVLHTISVNGISDKFPGHQTWKIKIVLDPATELEL